MNLFRLSRRAYAADLSGYGAKLYGGRWNSPGVAMLYTSDSRALAYAETMIHLQPGRYPKDYMLVTLEIPDTMDMQELTLTQLPANWRSFPHPASTRQIGDAFIRAGDYLLLRVPSAVVPGDFNYLLNPGHPAFHNVHVRHIEPFAFDLRL